MVKCNCKENKEQCLTSGQFAQRLRHTNAPHLYNSFHLPRNHQDSRTCSYRLCSYTGRLRGTHCQLHIRQHLKEQEHVKKLKYFFLTIFEGIIK